jgi:uncharacterized membrane protein
MKYVEGEDGITVDGYRATAIRRHARGIFKHLAQHDALARKWGQTSSVASDYFHAEMCKAFPELRLCERYWKSNQVAKDNYPSWRTNHMGDVVVKEDTNVESERVLTKRP